MDATTPRTATAVWKFLFILTLVLIVAGLGCNPFKNLMKNRNVRNLPGVQAVTGPIPPIYTSSILGVKLPQAVAVNAEGTLLYVAEGDGDRGVRVLDLRTRGTVQNLFPPDSIPGKRKPMSIALASSGMLFVVDRVRNAVDMYDPQGQWLGILSDPPTAFGRWEPLGVTVSPKGALYVTNANPEGPPLAEYDIAGRFLTAIEAGGSVPYTLSFPTSLAVLGDKDYTFVADSNSGRVVVLDQSAALVATYGRTSGDEALALPRGISIDNRGFVYVADVTSDNVKVWDASTEPAKFLFTFGQSGFADGEFLYPNSVAVDGNRRIYVADTGNDRVQIWRY